ncbi:MAG: DUF3488 and transglutaminase-like domain-containing protein [Turicibacter sp.]|nr:DUF3488 and transglutaminase-like domain-containing protein [Turicibacter sp.]
MSHEKNMKSVNIEKPSLADFAFLMTVGVLFAWTLVLAIINPTVFSLSYLTGFFKVSSILFVLGILLISKRGPLIAAFLLLGFSAFIAYGFLAMPEISNAATRTAELFVHTFEFIGGRRAQTHTYGLVVTWFIAFFISLFVAAFAYLRFRFLLLFIVSVIVLGVTMTSRYFSYTYTFYVFVFSLLVLLIRHLQQKNANLGVSSTAFTKYISILTALSIVIASVLPTPPVGFAEGVWQNIVQRPFEWVNDIVVDLTQPSEFSLRQIGFGGSGRLGGDVAMDDSLFMRIRTHRFEDPIYLTGAVMDTYTGYSWENRFVDERVVDFDEVEQNLELIEHLLSAQILSGNRSFQEVTIEDLVLIDIREYFEDYYLWYDWENMRIFRDPHSGLDLWVSATVTNWVWRLEHMFLQNTTIVIDVLDVRPVSAFHSGIVRHITFTNVDEGVFLRDRDGRFFTDSRMRPYTTYEVLFIEPFEQHTGWIYYDGQEEDMSLTNFWARFSYRGALRDVYYFITEFFTEFYEFHGYELDQEILLHGSRELPLEELLRDYLIPRADRIYETYTTLPDEFPERVRELAMEVTAEGETDYDRMRLLESYLTGNFVYTLTPGPSPYDRDFVDHFLFDLQRGYCVHFATAFVTMARSLGMPARYVEGFLVHTGPTVERGEGMTIDVLNNMAHAWAEVYFEGLGWIRFEPTPASGLPQAPIATGDGTGTHTPEIEGEEAEGPDQEGPGAPLETDGNGASIEVNGAEQVEADETSRAWLFQALAAVSVLVLIVVTIRVAIVHLKIKKSRRKMNNEAVLHLMKVMDTYFKVFGVQREESETVEQFAERLCPSFFDDKYTQLLLKGSAKAFSKARYGNALDIISEERRVMELIIEILDDRLKEQGRLKYLFHRYVSIKY